MKMPVFLGWLQVAIAMLNQAAGTGAIVMCYSVIAVPLGKTFAPSREVLMLAMTALYLVSGLVSPVLGAVMDRYSIRKVMLSGVLLLTGGLFLVSLATSMVQVILVYALVLSIAFPALGPLSYSVHVSRWFVRKRARAMGIAAMGLGIGGMIFPPLLQFLIDSLEWRDALRVFSGILFVLTIPVIGLFVIDRPYDRGLQPDGDGEPPPSTEYDGHRQYRATTAVLRDFNFWVITIVVAVTSAGSVAYLSNLVPLAISRGFTASQGVLILSCMAAGSFGGKALFAGFGDRIGSRVGLAAALTTFTLCSFCYLRANTYPILIVGGLLHGIAIGFIQPLSSVLLAHAFGPTNMGRIFGLMTLFLTPLTLVTPPLFGRIFDRTNSYDNGFILCICANLLAILLVTRIRVRVITRIASPA